MLVLQVELYDLLLIVAQRYLHDFREGASLNHDVNILAHFLPVQFLAHLHQLGFVELHVREPHFACSINRQENTQRKVKIIVQVLLAANYAFYNVKPLKHLHLSLQITLQHFYEY